MTARKREPGRPHGEFIGVPGGRRYIVHVPAAAQSREPFYVVYVPPFAEEMNKARRTWALLSQRLARHGFGTLSIDFAGTGDSDGEFCEATLPAWLDDLGAAFDYAARCGAAKIGVCALRFGALLAAQYLSERAPPPGLSTVVLVSPVTSGKTMLTQFLRLKMAAEMQRAPQERRTTSQLRSLLTSGQAVEIAGYELSSRLAAEIEALEMARARLPAHAQVLWLDVVQSAPSEGAGDRAPALGFSVAERRAVQGEPFWNRPEITVVPQVLDETEAAFARARLRMAS
jgi:exosortase A-associated hydrolase 2